MKLRFRYRPTPPLPPHPVQAGGRVAEEIARLGEELELEPAAVRELLGAYLPLCVEIDRRRRAIDGPLVVGVNGAQGSGKTTFARFAEALLSELHGWRVCGVSIDDFYLPGDRRSDLGRRVHPLLGTRGVPGTHDVALGVEVLGRLLDAGPDDAVAVPRFDKAVDDRLPREAWRSVRGPVDVVVFEGWCVGVPPQAEAALAAPVNALEAEEDPDGAWRRWVNQHLSGPYAEWFARIDLLLFLQVPGLDSVRAWRRLQEEKLARRRPGSSALMEGAALERFLMLYERITRHALATLPGLAEIVCALDDEHRIVRIDSVTPLHA